MRYFIALLATLLLSSSTFAAGLTDKDVKNWLTSYQSVMAWSKTQDQKDLQFMDKNKNPDMAHMFANSITEMKSHKIYGSFAGVLKKSGYSDPMAWGQMGDRIMSATMAVELEKRNTTSAAAKVQMQQALQQIQNNPNMSPEQKAQLQQMMGMSNQLLDVADKVPAEDKDAVRRNADLIKSMMKEASEEKPKTN